MGDFSGKINIEELLSYGNDLVALLKDQKDVQTLNQCLEHVKALQSFCDDDFSNVHSSVQGLSLSLYNFESTVELCLGKRRTIFSVKICNHFAVSNFGN